MVKSTMPKLVVVFDTNVLYTQVSSDLVRNAVKDLVQSHSDHTDLKIRWCLPEVVVEERRYQMVKKATELLPSIKNLELLLGHGFGLGEDTLELHVDKVIKESLNKLGLEVLLLDTSQVDWDSLINRSVKRFPPFEAGEKEKGFRDALIGQTFLQIQEIEASTPRVCRLVIVSEDKLLREYIQVITRSSKNVRILAKLDELESLINTLVSEIPEELVLDLTQKATNIFFEKDNEKCFYIKGEVGDKIRKKFNSALSKPAVASLQKTINMWWILEPVFIKKERSRIFWTTSVEAEFELYHTEEESSKTSSGESTLGEIYQTRPLNALTLLSGLGGKKIVDLTGRDMFEITWSTNLSNAQNLTTPKLENIRYLGHEISD